MIKLPLVEHAQEARPEEEEVTPERVAEVLLEEDARGELARRLLGSGRRFSPDRDAVAELVAERESEPS